MLLCTFLSAQHPDVDIQPALQPQTPEWIRRAEAFRKEGLMISMDTVAVQLQRRSTPLKLPPLRTEALSGRELWALSRSAHAIVTWHYLCLDCDHWHHEYAGGYFVTEDGVLATCEHVISPDNKSYREGYLLVITAEGRMYPVLEVLAADKGTDAALLRVNVEAPVVALPLNVSVFPGDCAWCYSAPLQRAGFFSRGIVNRFYRRSRDGGDTIRMQVSTDWAPGSSGSAVLDGFGNAIGHVSTILSASSTRPSATRTEDAPPEANRTQIVFRSATRAADVLALIDADE